MQGNIEIKEIQVVIRPYAICKNNTGVEYPGFCSLITDSKKESNPEFISGIGKIINVGSGIKNLYIGNNVAFCGHSLDPFSEEITTSPFNIFRINGELQVEYAYSGHIAHLINAIITLQPALGLDVVVAGSHSEKPIIMQILRSFGCNAYDDNFEYCLSDDRLADAGVIFGCELTSDSLNNLSSRIKCSGRIVSVGVPTNLLKIQKQEIHVCTTTGDDSNNKAHLLYSVPIPLHFYKSITKKNLEIAYNLISSKKINVNIENSIVHMNNIERISDEDYLDLDETIFPKAVVELLLSYRNHINPGLLSIQAFGYPIDDIKSKLFATAAVILQAHVADYDLVISKGIVNVNIRCKDGSVVQSSCIPWYEKKEWNAELHFDGTSIVLRDGEIISYCGNVVLNRKICKADTFCSFDMFPASSSLESWQLISENQEWKNYETSISS